MTFFASAKKYKIDQILRHSKRKCGRAKDI